MNIALKEWSAVIAALDRGAQTFLLRKGGIVESKNGFQPKYREFLLFPTFEHQHAGYLKPEYAELPESMPDRSGDRVHIAHLARVADALEAPRSLPALLSLANSHVWNEDFVRQRYNYRPDLPLYILVVRAYRLEPPQIIPLRSSYAGCRSWVHLTEEISTESVHPVLPEAEFARRRDALLELLDQS